MKAYFKMENIKFKYLMCGKAADFRGNKKHRQKTGHTKFNGIFYLIMKGGE